MTSETATCANCAALRQGTYCYACGQNDRDYRRSLPPMVWQLMAEAFELDGRILRTMKALLFKPGHLSVEFSANRRASYVSPIRLYLFTSIAFFFVLSLTADVDTIDLEPTIAADLGTAAEELPDESRFRSYIDPELHDDLDQILASNNFATEIVRGIMDSVNEDANNAKIPGAPGRFFYNQMIKALSEPTGFLGDLSENVPIALFFLLPVYAAILKLLYVRRSRYYVEHLVFALHLHAFAFIVFTIGLFFPEEDEGWLATVSTVLYGSFFVYYFLALRRYYAQSRRKTALKYVLLLGIYTICLAPAALLVLLVTFSLA